MNLGIGLGIGRKHWGGSSAPAFDYYVNSATGSDSNSGASALLPWKTVAKVNALTSVTGLSKKISFMGFFREQLTVPAQGMAIGGTGTITAAELVPSGGTSWVNESGSLWYVGSIAAEPITLAYNSVFNAYGKQTAKAGLTADQLWWYDSTNLRIYTYSATNPNTRYTAPGVEYGARPYAIYSTYDGLTVNGLTAIMANYAGISTYVNAGGVMNNVTFKDCTVSGKSAIIFDGKFQATPGVGLWTYNNATATGNTTQSSHFSTGNVSQWGIRFAPGGTFNNTVVTYNTVGPCGEDGIMLAESTHNNAYIGYNTGGGNGENTIDVKYGNGVLIEYNTCLNDGEPNIVIHFDTANVTLQHNICNGSGQIDNTMFGIEMGCGASEGGSNTVMTNPICRYNTVSNCQGGGITFINSTNGKIYGNTVNGWSISHNAAGVGLDVATGTMVANNTAYGAVHSYLGFQAIEGSTSTTFKNNIFTILAGAGNDVVQVSADSQSGTTLDYNLYFPTTSIGWIWGSTEYNWAGWKTNSGQDAHSLNADPLFTNAGAGDFTLQSGSPCINAGAVITGITDGYLGSAPDMGYKEAA